VALDVMQALALCASEATSEGSMPTTWLRHAALQTRYTCSRNSIDRMVEEKNLPPKSFPTNSAPMWPEAVLDCWDTADDRERKIILDRWPDWRGALATITEERAAGRQRSQETTRARKGLRERGEKGRKAQAHRRAAKTRRKQRRLQEEATA
jgi:hypothetical protein